MPYKWLHYTVSMDKHSHITRNENTNIVQNLNLNLNLHMKTNVSIIQTLIALAVCDGKVFIEEPDYE